jgi:hypothetical protein
MERPATIEEILEFTEKGISASAPSANLTTEGGALRKIECACGSS